MSATPLPVGMRVEFEADVQQLAADVIFGGSPARVLRLNPAGVRALAELRSGPVGTRAGAVLARRLTDAGVAHPVVAAAPQLDATVVIPVRDRVGELERCLSALGGSHPVVVVDDGSADPRAVAAACSRHGARIVHRLVNGGPGAARNAGLAAVQTEFVAFLDSDCVPPAGWIERLGGHFADPLVAAVAPRVVPRAGSALAGRYARARSPLDLGDRPARVAPMTRVAYVPTAALLVRRSALGRGFDERLRYGEDVDLVWRLLEAGRRIRYEPSVRVEHVEPRTVGGLLARRYRYGTSAAPLTRRHPGQVAPLVLAPWPSATVAAVLGRRPLLAAATFCASVLALMRRLRSAGLPVRGVLRPMAGGVWRTGLGLGRWGNQFAGPLLVALVARPGGRTRRTRLGRRAAALALLTGPPLAEWWRTRPGLDPARFTALVLADEAAYGAGVYAGCRRERTVRPVLPVAAVRPLDLDDG